MPCPVAPAESDTLSGRARRGLDRALAVGGGLGGGGMHRVGACRGGGGGTGQPCVSYTQLAGGQGAGPGGGTGGRRSPAGRRAQVCAGVIGFLFPRSGVFESASIAGWGRMHYTPPIPQGIRVWKPGCKAQSRSRAHHWYAAFSFAQHTARFMAGRVGTPARVCRSCPGLPTLHGLPPLPWQGETAGFQTC